MISSTKMGFITVTCPHCERAVSPTRFGRCPSCLRTVPRSTALILDDSEPPRLEDQKEQTGDGEAFSVSPSCWTAPISEEHWQRTVWAAQLVIVFGSLGTLFLMFAVCILPFIGVSERRMVVFHSLFFGIPAGLAIAATINSFLFVLEKRRITGLFLVVTIAATLTTSFITHVVAEVADRPTVVVENNGGWEANTSRISEAVTADPQSAPPPSTIQSRKDAFAAFFDDMPEEIRPQSHQDAERIALANEWLAGNFFNQPVEFDAMVVAMQSTTEADGTHTVTLTYFGAQVPIHGVNWNIMHPCMGNLLESVQYAGLNDAQAAQYEQFRNVDPHRGKHVIVRGTVIAAHFDSWGFLNLTMPDQSVSAP